MAVAAEPGAGRGVEPAQSPGGPAEPERLRPVRRLGEDPRLLFAHPNRDEHPRTERLHDHPPGRPAPPPRRRRGAPPPPGPGASPREPSGSTPPRRAGQPPSSGAGESSASSGRMPTHSSPPEGSPGGSGTATPRQASRSPSPRPCQIVIRGLPTNVATNRSAGRRNTSSGGPD